MDGADLNDDNDDSRSGQLAANQWLAAGHTILESGREAKLDVGVV